MPDAELTPRSVRGIDPRGPRFAAAITSVLLLADVFLALIGAAAAAFILLAVIAALFLWGVLWPRTAPWGVLYRAAVQPRLSPPTEFEDPRPPRFAQGVGLTVTVIGLVLAALGLSWGVVAAAAAAFVAAFLNAAFGLCLGCELHLVLQRAGIVGRRTTAAT